MLFLETSLYIFGETKNKMNNKNNQMIESETANVFSEAHKSETKTYFEIVDADWDMYHPKKFETEEEARKVILEEYQNRLIRDTPFHVRASKVAGTRCR